VKVWNTYLGFRVKKFLDLLDSLSRSSINLVLVRHEQAAGFMAATFGRLTGKAGVCLSTLGPGATNLVTAAAYANLGAMPMVMITGQKPIKTSKHGTNWTSAVSSSTTCRHGGSTTCHTAASRTADLAEKVSDTPLKI
jgi:glyoxylate carboligase